MNLPYRVVVVMSSVLLRRHDDEIETLGISAFIGAERISQSRRAFLLLLLLLRRHRLADQLYRWICPYNAREHRI
jgi:hypothetical protein